MRPASKIALRPRRVITERPWTSSQPRTTGSNAIDRAGSPEIGRLPQGPAGRHPGLRLNAKNWLSRNQCTAAQGGPGCPQTGIRFLADIGLIGRIADVAGANSG